MKEEVCVDCTREECDYIRHQQSQLKSTTVRPGLNTDRMHNYPLLKCVPLSTFACCEILHFCLSKTFCLVHNVNKIDHSVVEPLLSNLLL